MTDAAETSDEIDFASYRRPELAEQVTSLLHVPEKILTLVRCGILSVVLVLLIFAAIFGPHAHWAIQIVAYLLALVIGVLAGVLVGALLTINKGIEDLIEIITLSLGLTQQVVTDISHLRGGHKRIPSAQKLAAEVYRHVVFPLVERAILSQSRLLGRPLLWAYRLTLGSLLRRILALAPEESDSARSGPDARPMADEEDLEVAAESIDKAKTWLEQTSSVVSTVGHSFRVTVLIPMSLLAGLLMIALLIPAVLLWYFS